MLDGPEAEPYDPTTAPWDCNHRREIYQCSTQQLWERLGYFIYNAKPQIKVFKSIGEIEPFIQNATYPKVAYDAKRQIVVSDSICGAITFPNMPSDVEEVRAGKTSSGGDMNFQYTFRMNNTEGGSIFMPAGTLQIKTENMVTTQPSLTSSLIYSVTGFLGMQVVVNEFVLCNDYRNLTGSSTSNPMLEKIYPTMPLSCLNSPIYNLTTPDFRPGALYVRDQTTQTVSAYPLDEGLDVPLDAAVRTYLRTDQIKLGSFGIPRHLDNDALQYLGPQLFNNVWFGFCIPLLFIAGAILYEKELKIREGMKMMGLMDISYYLELLIFNGVWAAGIMLLVTIAFFALPKLVTYSNFFIIFLVFFLTLYNVLMLGTMITVFFNSSSLGKIVIFGVIYATSILKLILSKSWSTEARCGFAILPSMNLFMSLQTFVSLEFMAKGATFEMLFIPCNKFSIFNALSMNIVGILLWWVMYQYFDQVIPTDYGVPRPWYFPFTSTYWREVGALQKDKKNTLNDSQRGSRMSGGRHSRDSSGT